MGSVDAAIFLEVGEGSGQWGPESMFSECGDWEPEWDLFKAEGSVFAVLLEGKEWSGCFGEKAEQREVGLAEKVEDHCADEKAVWIVLAYDIEKKILCDLCVISKWLQRRWLGNKYKF